MIHAPSIKFQQTSTCNYLLVNPEKPHPHCLKYLYQELNLFLQKLAPLFQKLTHLLVSLKPFLQ